MGIRNMNHNQIAAILERAADRAEDLGYSPATEKQCWYLAGLMVTADDADDVILNTSLALTGHKASAMISGYIAPLMAAPAVVSASVGVLLAKAAADRASAQADTDADKERARLMFPSEWTNAEALPTSKLRQEATYALRVAARVA